ncbi:MAG TPA: sigma-70 family RNA polymerase sigma factor [Candidatus Acidoferrales bacterium]|jgi:RNA polymerase sigma-70 factor, ECF subfamily|nr:sigma-70 family RNA polymerase sigma factor [Candidatus Acidoferrales bacterium]
MGTLETSLASGSAIVGKLFRANIRSPESAGPDSRPRKLHSSDANFTSPVMRDDWDLIRQAIVGNPEAQERLFKTYTPRLYRAVFAVLRNREDAEDAVQESWCRAYANLHSFQGRAAFSTWLTRIAINSALMLRRRKSIRLEASLNDILDNQSEPFFDGKVAAAPNPEEIYVASELNSLIQDQIRKLPPRVQAAFRLRKIEEFSAKEAVQALGIRETALKSRVLRARKKVARGLRKLLSTSPRPHAVYRSNAQPRLSQQFASLRQPGPRLEQLPKT